MFLTFVKNFVDCLISKYLQFESTSFLNLCVISATEVESDFESFHSILTFQLLFRDRICQVFSTSEEEDGSISFEDFLDMMSVFSDDAPSNLKAEYAFKVYGERNM